MSLPPVNDPFPWGWGPGTVKVGEPAVEELPDGAYSVVYTFEIDDGPLPDVVVEGKE